MTRDLGSCATQRPLTYTWDVAPVDVSYAAIIDVLSMDATQTGVH